MVFVKRDAGVFAPEADVEPGFDMMPAYVGGNVVGVLL